MIQAIIIEDEPLAASLLSSYAEKVEDLNIIGVYHNPISTLSVLKDKNVDLLFLDVHMPELSGIEFAKIMPDDIEIIFTTAYPNYAVQGFELKALDYLLKPISLIRFLDSVNRYRTRSAEKLGHKKETKDYLFIKSEYKLQKIQTADLLYFQGNGDYCNVVCKNKKVLTLEKLSSFEKRLSTRQFIRVHKSYLVSTDKIESIERKRIKIGEIMIPIGLKYEEDVRRLLL